MLHSLGVIFLLVAGSVQAATAQFYFDFFDADGALIGDGFYEFDDIPLGTKVSFASLTNFSWEFNISTLGISLSSND